MLRKPTDVRCACTALLQLTLHCCLLSGGASRRMGQDKALLPHPAGGCWLDHALLQLATLQAPITVLSRWPQHHALATALNLPQLQALVEPAPWEGPLLALHRLMGHLPDQRLLLCPVDMPALRGDVLRDLTQAANAEPEVIHLAHDGTRSQPLLGVYPSNAAMRQSLASAIASGERRLQAWLGQTCCRSVSLDAGAIRNVNSADELALLPRL